MKNRSKLFLIVAGIIFIVGVLVCLVGAGLASKTGEQLYASKMGEEDSGYTYDFGDSEIDKVKISVKDADVNIIGGAERSYIEVINFNENLSSYVGNQAMITFTESGTADDVMGNLESILSFKGLRYILRPTPKDRPKTVNIYVSDDENVKVFDINIENGNIKLSSISTSTDYDLSLESGKINISKIKTGSAINVEASGTRATDVIIKDVEADSLSLSAKRASFRSESFRVRLCEMNVTAGGAELDFVPLTEIYTVDIATKGKLTVDGEVYPDRYKYPDSDTPVKTPEDGEETEEPSALIIAGDDFTVKLTIPAEQNDTEQDS